MPNDVFNTDCIIVIIFTVEHFANMKRSIKDNNNNIGFDKIIEISTVSFYEKN